MKGMKGFLLTFLFFAAASGCGENGLNQPGAGGGGGVTPTPAPTPEPPGSEETIIIGETAGLCNPGDVARVDVDTAGKARFPLVLDPDPCTTAKDNRDEEYTLILYNTTGSAMTFRMESPIDVEGIPSTTTLARTQPEAKLQAPATKPANVGPTEMSIRAAAMHQEARINKTPLAYGRSFERTMPSFRAIGIGEEAEFRVRSSFDDPDQFTTTSALLRAQGDHINLFVDRDVPYAATAGACALLPLGDDCLSGDELDRIAAIFDQNIYPLETTLLGDESDVDGDSRITVLLTPIVNRNLKVEAYTDPRNVLPFNPISNPGSNEGEIIFLAVPDSLGNYSASSQGSGVSSAEFVRRTLNGWIAFQFTKIISFNQHVLISGGNAEDDWIEDGIGSLMADLTGFNIFRSATAFFLNAPQTDDIRKGEELDFKTFEGGEYLFMLYYVQSQVDSTVEDADGDGFDDDLAVLRTLMTSGATSIEGLEAAVDLPFDATAETEFQSLFKDWTISIATSGTGRTDLQQSGQNAVKYFFNINPTVYGTGVANASGSVRAGADGGVLDSDVGQNLVGLDLNLYHDENRVLIENADEHVWAPGNTLFGALEPFTMMYVRLGGLFQTRQTLSIKGSSALLKGFLVRRTDINYPHVYSESTFGTINQYAEDLDTSGPNPYWTNRGISKRVDLSSMIGDSAVGGVSPDFLSIVGRIDPPDTVRVCPADTNQCADTQVPDTDKFIFTVPDLGRGDEGQLAVTVRRQFAEGSSTGTLTPILAVVSSKDVPYPYVPHPIRSAATPATRPQYRWMAGRFICGDGDNGDRTTVNGVDCTAPTADDIPMSRVLFEGSVENTGSIQLYGPVAWDGNIEGGECDNTPDLALNPPNGVDTSTGYGGGATFNVTDIEASPSSLGKYPWGSSFMTYSYSGGAFPDPLFKREFLIPTSGYPIDSDTVIYDPRSSGSPTLNCYQVTSVGELDEIPDSPDDLLEPGELNIPDTLAKQILVEMSRDRSLEGALPAQYQDNDVFAIDGDSRDDDSACTSGDRGNNMNTFTVPTGEGSILWADFNALESHISGNLHNSAFKTADQEIYVNGGQDFVVLTPGKSYTLVVGGTGGTVGNYELRIRKINQSRISATTSVRLEDKDVTCDFAL